MILAEDVGEGKVKSETYIGYIKAMGGPLIVGVPLCLFTVMLGLLTFNNYWLSLWFNDFLNGTMTEEVGRYSR